MIITLHFPLSLSFSLTFSSLFISFSLFISLSLYISLYFLSLFVKKKKKKKKLCFLLFLFRFYRFMTFFSILLPIQLLLLKAIAKNYGKFKTLRARQIDNYRNSWKSDNYKESNQEMKQIIMKSNREKSNIYIYNLIVPKSFHILCAPIIFSL